MAIADYITKSKSKEWQPLIEKGLRYEGVFVKSLRFDEPTNRSKTILLKFEAGASYPYHNHPAGEEIFVLKGSCEIEGEQLEQGDYLCTPPTGKHGVKSLTGCTLFLMIPEEVEIIKT
ncbi:cupin domain-containing protein [Flagellimonas meridianipacifica]|nr:cupin domain-containing protein [Allomuricauda pacifica]